VSILGVGEVLTPEDLAYGIVKVNRLLDQWNAQRRAVWCDLYTPFVFTPALSPHTIGPSGTWVVAQRPVTIESLELVIGVAHTPIVQRDRQWYSALPVTTTTTTMPTDVYYEPDWPNGKLYFWPVPSSASTVVVSIRQILTALTDNGTYTFPPGYQEALTLSLAESLGTAYPGAAVTPELVRRATDARALVFDNNTETRRIATVDAGMPGSDRAGAQGTWLTGWWPRR
jgi:hypothetical protein